MNTPSAILTRNDPSVDEPRPDRFGADLQQRLEAAEQRARDAERRTAAIERALVSSGPIEQAKGLVMGVFGLDAEAAFQVLVWVSQHANTKLAIVAERFLVEVGRTDFGSAPRESLTQLLDGLGRDRPRRAS